jgi:hypothetical protein
MPDAVFITDAKKYTLLPAQELKDTKNSFQIISGAYGKKKFVIQSYTAADKKSITMDLMNEMGTGLGQLSYKDGQAHCTSSFFPKQLKPAYIIADFQFCYYDEDSLKTAFNNENMIFTVTCTTPKKDVQTRKIFDGENCIEEITITSDSVHLINHLRGYEYSLKDIQQ